jgi:hypothetical protein
MIMAVTLWCNDPLNKGCHWTGEPDELVALTDAFEDRDFTHCPNCDGADFQEDDEYEEESDD